MGSVPRQFKEVNADDFTRFSKEQPSYVLIEQALNEIGGGGNNGVAFKKEALGAAGWKYGKLISYGAHPQTAAEAFNKVREVLSQTEEREDVLSRLKQ
ncbi:Hypothetical protein HDN1F_14280 [gamma proteobacterium HdN1]|nr:Hypothetical protein HDN1F_14280 [gamma proteobacterium HdN1]